MSARPGKSKKLSGGSRRSPSRPEDFVLYLDENLCNSVAIQETLTSLGVRFERHLVIFLGEPPNKNGWRLWGETAGSCLPPTNRSGITFWRSAPGAPSLRSLQ